MMKGDALVSAVTILRQTKMQMVACGDGRSTPEIDSALPQSTTGAGWQSGLFPFIKPSLLHIQGRWKRKSTSPARSDAAETPHTAWLPARRLTCRSSLCLVTVGAERAATQSGLPSVADGRGSPQVSSYSAAVQPQDHLRGTEEESRRCWGSRGDHRAQSQYNDSTITTRLLGHCGYVLLYSYS